MSRGVPDVDTLRAAIALAGRAPSIHNSQPWLWTMREVTLQLSAVRERWLASTDPAGRDMLLSCGAAVHHAQVAFAGLGWATAVHCTPSSLHPDRLASLRFRAQRPTEHDVALSEAIYARRSDRRPYGARAVIAGELSTVLAAAQRPGVQVRRVDPATERATLERLTRRAAEVRDRDPAWRIEQRLWAGPYPAPGVGIPTANAGRDDRPVGETMLLDAFQQGGEVGEILLLATDDDDPRSCLTAGESASALLLEATSMGMSSCPLSLVLEVDDTRAELRRRFFGSSAEPQLLVRLGWPRPDSPPLAATPRLRLDEILRNDGAPAFRSSPSREGDIA